MTQGLFVLLVALPGVVLVHTRTRTGGAIAASFWCLGALAFGIGRFQEGAELAFLGVNAPAWVFIAFVAGLLFFNVGVLWKVFRRARRDPGKPEG